MLRYKTDLMRHIHTLKVWFAKTKSIGNIDLETMFVHIRHPQVTIRLAPQFVTKLDDGRIGYSPQITPSTVGFVGWLPYQRKIWPLAQDKYAFKSFATANGLRTPRSAIDPASIDYSFIIKAARSSFGNGIRGPFRADEIHLSEVKLQPGEYYEEIIFGKIARAWYWDTQLAALEVFDMPTVTGDGQRSFCELVRSAIGAEAHLPTNLDRIAAVQGVSADAALPSDKAIVADYRYVSALNPSIYKNFNILESLRGSDVFAQFDQAGRILHQGIPQEWRQHTAFVVDAIVDNNGVAWMLEMNCNAQLHPGIYGVMLDEICSTTRSVPANAAPEFSHKVKAPMYTIDVATSADIPKVSQLRRAALSASKEFSLHDIEKADWSTIDDSSIVVTARLGDEIVSSTRMTIFRNSVDAQTFLEYPVARQSIGGPVLAMSRAVTSPDRFNLGLMAAVRYAYLTQVLRMADKIENVVAIVYKGGPRVNSMQRAGYVMIDCDDHWDSEAKLVAPPLIAVLPKPEFAQALKRTETEFASIIEQCSFDWSAINARFEQMYAIAR